MTFWLFRMPRIVRIPSTLRLSPAPLPPCLSGCHPSRFPCSLLLLWQILHNNFDATCETFSPIFTCTWQRMPNTDPTHPPPLYAHLAPPHTLYGIHLFNCRQAASGWLCCGKFSALLPPANILKAFFEHIKIANALHVFIIFRLRCLS